MDWRYNTVWLDQLPDGEPRTADFSQGSKDGQSLLGGNYLVVRSFKSRHKTFEDFPANGSVKYLNLTLANITSFKGVSVLGNVKRLELEYCLKLESDSGLSEIAKSVEWLHVTQSRKFSINSELLGLSELKVLCLNACAPLENLEFISCFPSLLDFRFVDTNVVSGDLSPLLRHPTLCSVGFLAKRHYNMSPKEIEAKLSERRSKAVTVVRKGTHETFKYNALSA